MKTQSDIFKFLGISDYEHRIYNSNSRGELHHLIDYATLADVFKDDPELFRVIFLTCVDFAENNWSRPESVFQHMPQMIFHILDSSRSSR